MKETLEEVAEIEKIAMDKLKSKWEHLYTFGYPQKPFPTNYENDFNNVKVGLYEGAKWQQQNSYSEEDLRKAIQLARLCTLDGNIGEFVDLTGLTEVCTYGLKETHSEDLIIEQFKKK
jgi:hypothetical protein